MTISYCEEIIWEKFDGRIQTIISEFYNFFIEREIKIEYLARDYNELHITLQFKDICIAIETYIENVRGDGFIKFWTMCIKCHEFNKIKSAIDVLFDIIDNEIYQIKEEISMLEEKEERNENETIK